MPGQIIGYYTGRSGKLLKDLDRTSALMKDRLVERYGGEFADALIKNVRIEYGKLIPEIPFIKGPRARVLNSFLLISAQELAVYLAMKGHGRTAGEAWELCHEALRKRLEKVPEWKRSFMRWWMFSSMVCRMVARRARKNVKHVFGDFEIEYLGPEGVEFDYGVDYLRCGNYNFVKDHGGEEFAPYVCMSDIALSDAMGWGLIRTETLADGCRRCDFRFRRGAATSISSKTPEVQEVIERIAGKEAGQGHEADRSR